MKVAESEFAADLIGRPNSRVNAHIPVELRRFIIWVGYTRIKEANPANSLETTVL